MSKYTTTIKNLIDNHFDFKLDSYPIFDENYRNVLNNKILNHYYENEIGFETAALFRFYLDNKLNEIMPYYNILYTKQSELLSDLTNNVNLRETLDRQVGTDTDTSSTSNSSSTGSNNSKNLFQDTPQGEITQTDINAQKWATNVTFDSSSNSNSISDNSSSTGESNTTENYVKNIVGKNGNKYGIEILNDLKNNLLNIDMMIINDLSELFMQIY